MQPVNGKLKKYIGRIENYLTLTRVFTIKLFKNNKIIIILIY